MNNFKALLTGTLLLFLSLGVVAQEASKNFTVKNFSKVSVSSGIDLYISQGTTESLNIKSSNDLLKQIVVEQDGDRITIKFKEGFTWKRMFNSQGTKAYLTLKNLTALSASGGSDVFTQNTIKATDLNVSASGGADLKLALNCKNLSVQVSGGSDADLTGTTENLDARSSGGSDLNAFGLTALVAKVSSSGGSDAYVTVTKALDAAASGGSDIHYKGNPSVKKSESGGSDVNRAN